MATVARNIGATPQGTTIMDLTAQQLTAVEDIFNLLRISTAPNDAIWTKNKTKFEEGVALALAGKFHTTETPGIYEVEGGKGAQYRVTALACTCPDHDFRPSTPCKHRCGREGLERLRQQRWTQTAPEEAPPEEAPQAEARAEEVVPLATSQWTEEPPAIVPDPPQVDRGLLLRQKQTIRELLQRLGHACATKEAYEEATLAHTGLVLGPENFPAIISQLTALVEAQGQMLAEARALAEALAAQAEALKPKPLTIPQEFITKVHGHDHVTYDGLLALAHDAGLTSLREKFVSVSETMAVAEGYAEFKDGRIFIGAADATPSNVQAGVKASWARMALTRAKARALRDALNIGQAAAEEIG